MRSCLFALVLLLLPASALAGVKETIATLAPSATVLVVDSKGNELIAQNADTPFVPASVTKIVTAWLALEVLGADYRFETRFYLDAKRVLYVKGGGDPYLISEELAPLATELVAKIGKAPITGIVVDASYYPSDLRIPGIENDDTAYDALNSALGVNFNTIYAERIGNKVVSAEEQTPITPIAIARFRAKGPPDGEGRISLGQDPAVGLRYAGELIAAFIRRAGGNVKGEISIGTVPKGLEPIMFTDSRARSRRSWSDSSSTRTIIPPTRSSSRSAAMSWAGRSVSRSRLRSRTQRLAAQGLADAIHLEEGSGISRDTRFTARGLAKVLELFAPHADLMHGHDGGLNKSGTMDGIRTLAGYADTSTHGRVRFVISLASNDETRFQLLQAIKAGL